MTMTDRQFAILTAIIEQYAEIAAPVGSVTLAKLFGVSSATIRSEMSRLEEMGLIMQPHTSAGRIPTDKGYRVYVNNITEAAETELIATLVGLRGRCTVILIAHGSRMVRSCDVVFELENGRIRGSGRSRTRAAAR